MCKYLRQAVFLSLLLSSGLFSLSNAALAADFKLKMINISKSTVKVIIVTDSKGSSKRGQVVKPGKNNYEWISFGGVGCSGTNSKTKNRVYKVHLGKSASGAILGSGDLVMKMQSNGDGTCTSSVNFGNNSDTTGDNFTIGTSDGKYTGILRIINSS